jgi:pyruvate dehydrogenase E2 component (dihydrolipoamide acetyltransferase)
MEFEAVDEGIIGKILIPEGTDNVKVGTVIAVLVEEGEAVPTAAPKADAAPAKAETASAPKPEPEVAKAAAPAAAAPVAASGDRLKASPLARRIAAQSNIDLASLTGTGPNGRIVKADLEGAKPGVTAPQPAAAAPASAPAAAPAPAHAPVAAQDFGIPHEVEKLSNMRKTIARRLTESKQTVPHIYLTVDIRLDALLKLRTELNAALGASGVKLSVNDMMIKALAKALLAVPKCNVQFAGDQLLKFSRADISVAVSIPAGLITPIIVDAGSKAISAISAEMKDLASRAKEGKLKPEEFQGGTASLSNMGMYGIKQFEAVINPPQAMIMAIGAGEKRPYIVDDALAVASVMSATGSFDHRAIDGADGAQLMKVFKELVEAPLGLVA